VNAEDLNSRFKFHPATGPGRAAQHDDLRQACRTFASIIDELVPDGREKNLAVAKLEEVMFWGNAGIARQVL